MREKKFRKITEKNISSIYGKILNIRKKWIYPNIFEYGYITPMMLSYKTYTSSGKYSDFIQKHSIITSLDVHITETGFVIEIPEMFMGCKKYNKTFSFEVGDKIFLSGSSIQFKYRGIHYTITVNKIQTLPQPGEYFDSDKLFNNLYGNMCVVVDSIDSSCYPGIPIPRTTFAPGVDREVDQRILSEKMKIALEDQDQFLPSGKEVNLDTFKGFVAGIGSKPEPMKPLPNFPYFTENDLPSMENVLYLRKGI